MSSYRSVVGYAKEPIQQSMVQYADDNMHIRQTRLELGVVLNVYRADNPDNISAQQSQIRRGFRHECDVQIVGQGHGGPYRVRHVTIPPKGPSGVDSYMEHLPRGSTQNMDGTEYDTSMQLQDPYILDGDWCVVGFLNMDNSQPFIISWWPNPNNRYDPQTEGFGNPDPSGDGTTLNQTGRIFERLNGIEKTITPDGDIYINTSLANSTLQATDPSQEGRFARLTSEEGGGSIRVTMKDTASFEFDWTKPVDGIGILDETNQFIPQSNPSPQSSDSTTPQEERENTYLKVDQSVLELDTPDSVRVSSEDIELTGGTNLLLTATNVDMGVSDSSVVIRGTDVTIGDDAAQFVVKHSGTAASFETALTAATSAGTGSDTVNALAIETIQAFLTLLASSTIVKAT